VELSSSVSAVVTGGASGLGLATVKALRTLGVKVAIFDMNTAEGEAVAAETGAVYCNVDVTNDESVNAGFASARAANSQERILVNCAGTGNAIRTAARDKEGTIKGFPIDAFDRIVQINLVGTFRCIVAAATGMLTLDPLDGGERGVIVNTSSAAAQDGQIGQASYAASKAGIAGMTLPVARDLSREGIRVNTIMPGLFNTPPLQRVPGDFIQMLGKQVPFPPRLGDPAEYASLALEMMRNGYFNGETVRLDGAIRMAPK
jgi:NAD(P)-dependent dehydrogenase (short-subunit alcohol dehydrogenase family)